MADNANITTDDHALRIVEVAHGIDDDGDDRTQVDDAMIARLLAAIDQAFERAWERVRAQARAEVDAQPARPRRDLVTWTREQLLDRLDALRRLLGPQLQLAHRKLEAMPDGDLRSLIDDLEEAAAAWPRGES